MDSSFIHVYFNIFSFIKCEYCPVTAPTVSVVSKCPRTKTEWDQAAFRKKCNYMSAKCGDKSPVYHCLLNQWRNETVEVCASTWFISGSQKTETEFCRITIYAHIHVYMYVVWAANIYYGYLKLFKKYHKHLIFNIINIYSFQI